jgi:hypothetical protein
MCFLNNPKVIFMVSLSQRRKERNKKKRHTHAHKQKTNWANCVIWINYILAYPRVSCSRISVLCGAINCFLFLCLKYYCSSLAPNTSYITLSFLSNREFFPLSCCRWLPALSLAHSDSFLRLDSLRRRSRPSRPQAGYIILILFRLGLLRNSLSGRHLTGV